MIKTEDIFWILILVAFALIFARFLGYIVNRLKQPPVIGEILAGILLGGIIVLFFSGQKYFLFDISIPIPDLSYYVLNEELEFSPFYFLAEIGILFLLFISGLETSITRLKKTGKISLIVAIGGVIAPFLLGFFIGLIVGFEIIESVAIGLILTATSVGVTVRTLMDMEVLNSEVGSTILGAAVIDDIIGIILLALAIGISSLADAIWIGIRIAIFFFVFLYIGLKIIDKILKLGEKIILPKAFLSISLSILFIYAFFAEESGISGIIGAFVAGILIGTNIRSKKIEDDIKAIGYGFFIPIFFVWVGTKLWANNTIWQIDSIVSILILSTILISVGIIGKILGCGLAGRLSGLTNKESLQVGVGMIPRMELALIIVTATINSKLIPEDFKSKILAATIILTIFTTLLTPILIKATFKNEK